MCVCVCVSLFPAIGLLMVHSLELLSNCCFVALKKGVTPKIRTCVVLSFKLAFFLTVYVFGACFGTLAIILVSDLSK